MKYLTSDLKSALAAMMPIVPARTPLEYLKCLRITGQEIQARSGEVYKASRKIPGGDDGVIVVDARLLSDIVSTIKSDECELVDNSHSIAITAGGAKFFLPKRSDEFVFNDPGELSPLGTLTGKFLKDTVSDVYVSTSDVSGAIAMSSIGISWPLIYATDSNSIAMVRVGEGEPSDTQLLIAREQLKQIAGCFTPNDDVEISASEKAIRFKSHETEVTCRLVDGVLYKVWKKLGLPMSSEVTIDPGNFLDGLRQAFITTNPESAAVSFDFKNDFLLVTSQGKDKGKTAVNIPSTLNGDECHVDLDSDRLKRFISRINPSGDPLTIKVSENMEAVTINQRSDYTYVAATLLIE